MILADGEEISVASYHTVMAVIKCLKGHIAFESNFTDRKEEIVLCGLIGVGLDRKTMLAYTIILIRKVYIFKQMDRHNSTI